VNENRTFENEFEKRMSLSLKIKKWMRIELLRMSLKKEWVWEWKFKSEWE